MALSIDGTATNNTWSTAASGTVSLTTTNAADIIIVWMGSESTGTPAANVSSVTGTGMTFAKRSGAKIDTNSTQHFSMVELWWAYASAALTAVTITVNTDKTIDDACIQAFGVTGFTGTSYQTNPWDPNAALPVVVTQTTVVDANIPGISTTNAATMVLGLFGTVGSGGLTTPSAGYTNAVTHVGNTGAVNQFALSACYQVFAAAQTGITAGYGADRPAIGFLAIGDALAMTGGSAAATVIPVFSEFTDTRLLRQDVTSVPY